MELLEKMNMNVKKTKVRVLVADDHPLVRRGMIDLVNQEEDLAVCGEAGSGQDTLRLAAELERFRQQACEQAERRAAATRRGAGEQARRLAEVGDEELRGILARHLVAMVTGRSS